MIKGGEQAQALKDSASWRITQALRLVAHQVKGVRRVAELAMSAIRRGGGLKCLLKKAIQLYRREGLVGVKRRFKVNDYTEWIHRYDTLTPEMRANMRARIDVFAHKRRISVLMPVYNTNPKWLKEAIDSVRQQLYPYWELCIADDVSTDPRIRPILERYAQEDMRIKVVFREVNGHISDASNSALGVATGEYVALLDHDDMLAAHALYMVAEEVSEHPEADIIYSDEDKIDERNKRFDPHFKSDWNPDLFYSQNYVSHLGVYRTHLVRELGGFRKGYEGSQDYDLCLRCVAKTKERHIRHIPHVLYHWRAVAGSTALATGEKKYAEIAGSKALSDYFRTINSEVTVEFGEIPTTYRVRFPLPSKPPLVSLVIPTRNGFEILKQCIESIKAKTTYPNYEIIIVDNQSDEALTLGYLAELGRQHIARILRYDKPFNFSAINNYAVAHCAGELVGLINNDIEIVSPEWLSEMVSHALRPEVGAVGAKLMYGDGRLQHAGVIVGLGGVAGHSHKYFAGDSYGYFFRLRLLQNLSAVTAACLVVRKSVYQEVGGLEEQNLTIAFNDVDFCLRIRDAGYRNLWTPYALMYHHESVSRGAEDSPEKIARFQQEINFMKKRWGMSLLKDPYYNVNLTLDLEDFSIAWPPRVQPPWRANTYDWTLQRLSILRRLRGQDLTAE